ncbi:MAG: DUF3108 domain-containing protein [Xanthobacteraceae bacterium]
MGRLKRTPLHRSHMAVCGARLSIVTGHSAPSTHVRTIRTLLLIPFRFARRNIAAATLLAVTLGWAGAAQAQGKLEARYTASLSGVPIGTGSWFVGVGEDQYVIGANGSTAGLLRLFASGSGNAGVQGNVVGGRLVSTGYAVKLTANNMTDQISIALSGGTVKQLVVDPPQMPSPDRVPFTDAHYHGVTDPMTGSLVRVAGAGDPVSPEACQGSTAIFDGRMRYELRLAFKRMESVRVDKGYQGPVVVCAIYFTPIAGHIPGRPAIKYLTQLIDMEVWLAPIANTRLLAPFRVSIPTPFGLGVLQAVNFVSAATPGRSTAANAKTQ